MGRDSQIQNQPQRLPGLENRDRALQIQGQDLQIQNQPQRLPGPENRDRPLQTQGQDLQIQNQRQRLARQVNIKNARLKSKSRRPLQRQRQRRPSRIAGWPLLSQRLGLRLICAGQREMPRFQGMCSASRTDDLHRTPSSVPPRLWLPYFLYRFDSRTTSVSERSRAMYWS